MAHSYTPGLRVSARALVQRLRQLPLPGQVMVELGSAVEADTIVARTDLPGDVANLHVANLLGIDAADVPDAMLCAEGDAVKADQVIARGGGFLGMFKTDVKPPVDGTIESISKVTGQVLVRGRPRPLTVDAYVRGQIERIDDGEGALVKAEAVFVQGIFGIGGEARGPIRVIATSPAEPVLPSALGDDLAGAIVVGGAFADLTAIRAAIDRRVAALVVGGVPYQALSELLGYPIGVAVTGSERVGITLVVTEGFGSIPMAQRTFQLLRANDGRIASVNGATQIRAGVIRPEVLVPLEPAAEAAEIVDESAGSIEVGSEVRIIREPYFGLRGKVSELPSEPTGLLTEARVRIAQVTLEDGRLAMVARSNLERIAR